MRESRENGAGMRDQDPPFQTLLIEKTCCVSVTVRAKSYHRAYYGETQYSNIRKSRFTQKRAYSDPIRTRDLTV